MNQHAFWRALSGALLSLAALPALAQAYPAKPVEVIVHTSAGSGGDILSRAVAEIVRREKLLSQPLVVTNRVGGSGTLAYNFFKTKRGDPYYLLSVTGTIFAMAYRPDTNIPLENYTPVALMAVDPQTVMVPANSPYKNFKELVEAARKSPETLVAATTSVQGTGRLLVHMIEKAVPGAKFRFVTFKGGADAVTSTAGGHTTFTTENLSEGLGFVQAKSLRVLAISADRRLPQAPDVPTRCRSWGIPLPPARSAGSRSRSACRRRRSPRWRARSKRCTTRPTGRSSPSATSTRTSFSAAPSSASTSRFVTRNIAAFTMRSGSRR